MRAADIRDGERDASARSSRWDRNPRNASGGRVRSSATGRFVRCALATAIGASVDFTDGDLPKAFCIEVRPTQVGVACGSGERSPNVLTFSVTSLPGGWPAAWWQAIVLAGLARHYHRFRLAHRDRTGAFCSCERSAQSIRFCQ